MSFANKVSASRWRANQCRIPFFARAYTLLGRLRRLVLIGTAIELAACEALRVKLVKI